LAALTAQTHEAAAYAHNNRYYVNSSGHVVHSASCGEEKSFRHTAECRDGSTSFSEHHRAPAPTTLESRIRLRRVLDGFLRRARDGHRFESPQLHQFFPRTLAVGQLT
jgi:hypothetical protein